MVQTPLIQGGTLKVAIKILTDYPRDDLAHDEVHQALVTACAEKQIDLFNVDVGAIPGMDTVVAGFKTAQLAMNSKLGFGHIIHANCAPRKNIVTDKSQGERIVLGVLSTGVVLLLVNSGQGLGMFKDWAVAGKARFFETSVPDSGSQFRSRDYFPEATAEIAKHLQDQFATLGEEAIMAALNEGTIADIVSSMTLCGTEMDIQSAPQLPLTSVMYVDNFGNIKTNLPHDRLTDLYEHGTALAVCIGDKVHDAVLGRAGFSQGEGVLALTKGSSGWTDAKGEEFRFAEIFLRGQSAAEQFMPFHTGDRILAVPRDDMKAATEALKQSNTQIIGTVDLYNLSEASLIKLFAEKELLVDGYDARPLQGALAGNTLLQKIGVS